MAIRQLEKEIKESNDPLRNDSELAIGVGSVAWKDLVALDESQLRPEETPGFDCLSPSSASIFSIAREVTTLL